MSQPGSLILEVPCPTCGALVGEPCEGTTARAAKRYGAGHSDRALASRDYGARPPEAPGSTETASSAPVAPEPSPPAVEPGRPLPPPNPATLPGTRGPWPRRPGP